MKWLRDLEYAGWGFLAIAFAVLLGPIVYWFYAHLSNTLQPAARVVIGACVAGVAAAVVTFAANELIQRSRTRHEEAEKKAEENARLQKKLDRKLRRHERKKAN